MKLITSSEFRKRGTLLPIVAVFCFLLCSISFPAEAQTILWNEDWEDGNWTDWSVTAGTWEVGVPTSGPMSAHGGTQCAGTNLSGNYAPSVDSRLVSPAFVVPPSDQYPALRSGTGGISAPPIMGKCRSNR